MNIPYTLLLALACIIILALLYYAWTLHSQLKRIENEQALAQAAAEQKLRERQLDLLEDIRFIARSVLAEQCEITEGVMRIHYLLTGLDSATWQRDELATLREHQRATCGMPIMDAYKALSKKEQFQVDNERFRLENKNRDALLRELKWLAQHNFPSLTLLH